MSLPPEFDAVITKFCDVPAVVGVPESSPEPFSNKPVGKDGDTDHELTAPPVFVGDNVVIVAPTVRVKAFDE